MNKRKNTPLQNNNNNNNDKAPPEYIMDRRESEGLRYSNKTTY